MMASSSSSSDLNADHHLLQDDLPWSSSLPLVPALHHTIGGNHQWSQPLMLDHLSSDELEALLSEQRHHHNHSQLPAAPTPHQLSSLLMMQELGFQWGSCAVAETENPMLITSQQDAVKEELPADSLHDNPRSSTIVYNDIIDGASLPELDGAVVLPSVNVSRLQKPCPAVAARPLAGGEAFEMLASARLCKSLLSQAASSALLVHNGGMSLLREHVPYGPPAHCLQGPSIHSYKQMGVPAALVSGNGNVQGRGGHGSSASCHDQQQLQVQISRKKPRLESRSSTTIVPSFKVRKEKLGDRIAALQQLVSPFGKTDTASVLMEAIGYIKFLQDQVETLSGPYMRSSKHKKARTTQQRGTSNAGEKDEAKIDLRSRGLCLVPLSCTSYVTNENGVWAPPNFRGN